MQITRRGRFQFLYKLPIDRHGRMRKNTPLLPVARMKSHGPGSRREMKPPPARGVVLLDRRRYDVGTDAFWAQELNDGDAYMLQKLAPASLELVEAIGRVTRPRLQNTPPDDQHPSPEARRADHLWDNASPFQRTQLFRLERLKLEGAEQRRLLGDVARRSALTRRVLTPNGARKAISPVPGSRHDAYVRQQAHLSGSSAWWAALRGEESEEAIRQAQVASEQAEAAARRAAAEAVVEAR